MHRYKKPQRSPLRLRFLYLHTRIHILRDWYSYLRNAVPEYRKKEDTDGKSSLEKISSSYACGSDRNTACLCAGKDTGRKFSRNENRKKSEQQGTQSQYKQSQSKVSSLEGQQDALEEEIQELDSQLVEVIASVSLMQDQISDTEKQIVKAQEDYDVAKAQEDAQYLAMKKRLRYLYEKGDTSYIEILSNASNWSGMLNQANYVEKLYEYDKQMLNRYILIKEEVAQKKNDLEDKKERPGNAEI